MGRDSVGGKKSQGIVKAHVKNMTMTRAALQVNDGLFSVTV